MLTQKKKENDNSPIDKSTADQDPQKGIIAARFDAVKQLHAQLTDEAKSISAQRDGDEQQSESGSAWTPSASTTASAVPSGFRRQKLSQVMALLQRETALVDAVSERLGRLQGAAG